MRKTILLFSFLLLQISSFCQPKIKTAEEKGNYEYSSKIDKILLDKDKIANLKILGLIWGFIKYYHPNVAAGDYDMDVELFRIIPRIISTKEASQRDNIFVEWIDGFGEFKLAENANIDSGNVTIWPDLEWIEKSGFSRELSNVLMRVKNSERLESNFYISVVNSVGNPEFKNENPYSSLKYPDTGFRLLALYRYWNIINYFYPYKSLFISDWKNALIEFIPKIVNAKSEIEYKLILLELIGRVRDTHANIWGKDETLQNYYGLNYAPVQIDFIENKAIVTGFYEDNKSIVTNLRKGDEIFEVNDLPVDKIVNERLKYTPASNYTTQLRDIAATLLRTNDTAIEIGYRRDGVTEKIKIKELSKDISRIYKKYRRDDTCFKLLDQEIAYIHLGSFKSIYLPVLWREIENTKGLIIDLRCYPSEFIVFNLAKYLMPESREFVKFSTCNVKFPGLFTYSEPKQVGYYNPNYYKGKIMILINEKTQSLAEYTAMAFKVAPKVKIIGSTTAGADGDVSRFYLPGGVLTMISGIGVNYPNGQETQGVGIIPDIDLKPTIEGIKMEKDELLEKAVELIRMQ